MAADDAAATVRARAPWVVHVTALRVLQGLSFLALAVAVWLFVTVVPL